MYLEPSIDSCFNVSYVCSLIASPLILSDVNPNRMDSIRIVDPPIRTIFLEKLNFTFSSPYVI